MERHSLGLVETKGYVAAVEAADAGIKSANVRLLGYENGKGGIITVKFSGDVAAVQAAVRAGAVAAQRVGKVIAAHVIPRPDRQLDGLTEHNDRPKLPKKIDHSVSNDDKNLNDTNDSCNEEKELNQEIHNNEQSSIILENNTEIILEEKEDNTIIKDVDLHQDIEPNNENSVKYDANNQILLDKIEIKENVNVVVDDKKEESSIQVEQTEQISSIIETKESIKEIIESESSLNNKLSIDDNFPKELDTQKEKQDSPTPQSLFSAVRLLKEKTQKGKPKKK